MRRSLSLAVAVLSVSILAGCANKGGPARSTATVDSLTSVRSEMQRGVQQLDVTMTALDDLVNRPSADLRRQYSNFVRQLDRLESIAAGVRDRNAKLKTRADAYFEAWGKELSQVQNPEYREIGQARRLVAQSSFQQMTQSYAEGKSEFTPLMENLRDIKSVLGFDLTPAGINVVRPIAEEAKAHAEVVRENYRQLDGELNRVVTELTPSTTQPSGQ